MIASHYTEDNYTVYQPTLSPSNYAGWAIDRGTNYVANETDKSKPDAAVWVVAWRTVSSQVPVGMCGWNTQWARVAGYALNSYDIDRRKIIEARGVWKIGRTTGCTGTTQPMVLWHFPEYAGEVYLLPHDYLQIERGDSGGIVFTRDSNNNLIAGTTCIT